MNIYYISHINRILSQVTAIVPQNEIGKCLPLLPSGTWNPDLANLKEDPKGEKKEVTLAFGKRQEIINSTI